MMNKVNFRYLFLLAWFTALSTKAQVSSENYVQTTERISDTRHKTPEGYLVCLNVPIARAGSMEYLDGEVDEDHRQPEQCEFAVTEEKQGGGVGHAPQP